MNICFLSRFSPSNHNSWSGICYQMFFHLSASHNVEWIGNKKLDFWLRALIRLNRELDRVRKKKRGYSHLHKFICVLKAKNVERLLSRSNFDIIFTVNSPDYIAYLNTKIPIVYSRDATFELFIDYYPSFFGLSRKQIQEGNDIEKNALEKAATVVYSSKWAADSAINYYGIPPSRVTIVDFGANLLSYPDKNDIPVVHAADEVCHLLFVGVDWHRKGGALTYKIYKKLKQQGFHCTLTIVGCRPETIEESAEIHIVPFLDKQNIKDFNKLYALYLRSHFLVLPTQADCTPIVFSEAAAFGLPVITANTGGISSVIQEGVNGFLMPADADEVYYAGKIKAVFQDNTTYNQLRKSSRNEYDTRLSWDVWTTKVNQLLDDSAIYYNDKSLNNFI